MTSCPENNIHISGSMDSGFVLLFKTFEQLVVPWLLQLLRWILQHRFAVKLQKCFVDYETSSIFFYRLEDKKIKNEFSFFCELTLQWIIENPLSEDRPVWFGPVGAAESGLDNSGWESQWWWPTKLLTRCGEQCEFNWPRPWAVSGGQRVTSDNRERAGWLVNRGHGVWKGGQRGAGHAVVAAQFTGAGVCSAEFSCFVFGTVGHAPHHQSWTGGFIERWAALCSHGDHCNAVVVEGPENSVICWFCGGNRFRYTKTLIQSMREYNQIDI